jgi:hypothetical protein
LGSVIDCIYVAASARDARYTRICVASIRYFYPDVPIRLLAGSTLQRGLAKELHRYWGVELVDLPRGDYGWGLVKLEPLFGPAGHTFLLMDADTVLAGPVLDLRAPSDAPFFVDNEKLPKADSKRLYYDWESLSKLDPNVQSAQRAFNSGQWFGTAGLLTREDFDPWINWTMPRTLRHPEYFMGGEQGVLNYVVLQKEALSGLRVDRCTIMRWPGHSMDGLDAESVSKRTAPPLIVHWAGMKKMRLRHMVGSDLLLHFERFYYDRLPGGTLRRFFANYQHFLIHWLHWLRVRMKLAYRKWVGTQLSNRDASGGLNQSVGA